MPRKYQSIIAVYAIKNRLDNKIYIGSTVNISQRWSQHRAKLTIGNHPNKHLQNAWNKYGPDAFDWFVLEYLEEPTRLLEREQYFIDLHQAANREFGYNSRANAESSLGHKISEEGRANMSLAQLNRVNKGRSGWTHSDEAKKKIGLAGLGREVPQERREKIAANLKGHTVSQDARAKISAVQVGRKAKPETIAKIQASRKLQPITEETRAKLVAAATGRKLSDETRKKLSEINKGKKPTQETIEKRRASLLGRKLSDETKAKLSAARKRYFENKRKET